MAKIVCLGAGSYCFGLNALLTLLKSPALNNSEIALVDNNQESLDLISSLANWLNIEWDCKKEISSHSSHKTALNEADFVINAIEVQPREQLWCRDFELTEPYGLRQPYAENGGPGGFAHAARNANTILSITKDMEKRCPQAWFINYSNPMHRICYLVHQYSKIKVVGLCHQLGIGYAMAAKALSQNLGIDPGYDFISSHADPKNHNPQHRMATLGEKHLRITAAGLNHFTWMLSLENRKTHEDLYPLFRKRWFELPKNFEPLTREIFKIFGLFPIPGDEHLCEYLPWMSNQSKKPWLGYDLSLYNWKVYESLRERQWAELKKDIQTKENPNKYANPTSEGAVEIIESILTDTPLYWEALNLPNNGRITYLPDNAIVETPGHISSNEISGIKIGEIPKGITNLLQREVYSSQLCIDAVVNGDRELALQSLLLDPVVNDIELGKQILDDILRLNHDHLPQF